MTNELAAYRTLVLEGCDGAGKSTLAAHLADQHGFTVVHSPRTPDSLDLITHYRELLALPGRLILDRCFISELVYGPFYRGVSRITWAQAHDLARAVCDRDGALCHLSAPAEVIRARLLARDGRAPSHAQVAALLAGYSSVFQRLGERIPVITLQAPAGDEVPSSG
ncbi:hypothetical protein [Streptomyces sp. NBC_00347]|uniref:hypothetical protein n=1 Tax=Streptomyces sp. NBC_00347 TaxID=2975721 RepID=UPI002253F028|nr:hypothetical protein [Streptomyces sp. NBC_00347]MCX5124583.1 hypothetical protein [Streptomyces sp. NBC_00347]